MKSNLSGQNDGTVTLHICARAVLINVTVGCTGRPAHAALHKYAKFVFLFPDELNIEMNEIILTLCLSLSRK